MLPSFDNYCHLIANLPNQYLYIQSSTLSTYTISAFAAEVEGQITFKGGYELYVWELLDLSTHTIRHYSYKLERAGETIWWYDPQEHPNDPKLASTHPHHKHIHPDIKHHRVPTPAISFKEPNLPFLVQEVGQLLSESGG